MRIAACLLLLVAGCNTGVEQMGDMASERPLSDLEIACLGASTDFVDGVVLAAEADWLAGFTQNEGTTAFGIACASNQNPGVCLVCGTAVIIEVYDILGPPPEPEPPPPEPEPPPTFVSGHVFSFLTPFETEFFLSRVGQLNRDIEEAIAVELGLAQSELQSRGGGTFLSRGLRCRALRDELRAKREGTWIVLQDLVGPIVPLFTTFEPSEIQEILDFNCREYPNFSQDYGGNTGILPSACVVDFPCTL